MFENLPKVKVGIVAVSRDCSPESLSVDRRKALVKAYEDKYGKDDIYECPICIVESEIHMVQALEDVKKQDVMHLLYILVTSVPRFPKLCSQSILTDLQCSWQQQKKAATIWLAAEAMLTVVCSM